MIKLDFFNLFVKIVLTCVMTHVKTILLGLKKESGTCGPQK